MHNSIYSAYIHNPIFPFRNIKFTNLFTIAPNSHRIFYNPTKHIFLCTIHSYVQHQSVYHSFNPSATQYQHNNKYMCICDEIYQQKNTPSYHTHPINTSDPKHVKASNILQSNSHRKSFTSLILLMLRVSKCRISVTSIFICCTA